jgi:preprotein translocase subunit SecY
MLLYLIQRQKMFEMQNTLKILGIITICFLIYSVIYFNTSEVHIALNRLDLSF